MGFVAILGGIHSTKIPTGPTGKSGPPQKMNPFFETFPVGPNRSIEFSPTFPEILVEWIAPIIREQLLKGLHAKISIPGQLIAHKSF